MRIDFNEIKPCPCGATFESGLILIHAGEGPGFSIEHFNYKEEKDRYWHDRNQENARSYYGMADIVIRQARPIPSESADTHHIK